MRTLCLALMSLGLVCSAAAPRPALAAKPAAKAASTKYVCPKCGATADKKGECAHCKVAMVPATYECAHCKVYSAKAGKCPKCGAEMTKVGGAKK